MALSPDERLLAIAYSNTPTWLFDATTGEPLFSMEGFADRMVGAFFQGPYSVSFSPDSRRLATGGADGFAHIWDVETGERLLAIEAHDPAVSMTSVVFGTAAVNFSPDGSRLATAGSDGWVRVWDAQTGEELLSFMVNEAGVRNVEYSPDGRLLATGSEGGTANIWDARTGEELHSFPGHPTRVSRIVFSPDVSLLATTGDGGLVRVFSVVTGELQYALPSQNSTVLGMRFSPDSRYLATGGGDAVRLWDAATGVERLTLAAGPGDVAFSRDGTRLYYDKFGSGPFSVLALPLEDLTAIAESRLTRALTEEECRQYLHIDACP
jgi:WD40 repeat protein